MKISFTLHKQAGQMPMGWSYSASDAYDSVHAAAGFVYITFY